MSKTPLTPEMNGKSVKSLLNDSTSAQFWAGVRRAVPVVLSAGPFGALFGALAFDNGLTPAEAVLMSGTVFAGASQMVGIGLFSTTIAPWMIVATIFAVNFRHVLYSAAVGRTLYFGSEWKRHLAFFLLTDPQFAETESKRQRGEEITFPWYMGVGIGLYVPWLILAWVGAHFGRLITDPASLGFDFLLPLYFLGLVLSFHARPLWLPVVAVSAAASIATFFTIGSPWHVTAGAFAGVTAAAMMAKPHDAEMKAAAGNTQEKGTGHE
jgi:predicted branched-subunit amino acid permease